jgi:Tol biopolymer transport system component
LERILSSGIFKRSERLSEFLRFVVERSLEDGGRLKEQVLAAELYGKGPDFDGGADAVVRVDARRLRDKLREYYAEHADDPVRISLPKGGYVPAFETARGKAAEEAPQARRGPERWTRSMAWVAAGTAAMALAWLAQPKAPYTPPKIVPLTAYPGDEGQPAVSPDGNAVAFRCESAEEPGQRDICVKAVGSEGLQRITSTSEEEHWPAWSPDGREISFGRSVRGGAMAGIFVVSRMGGNERKISETGLISGWTPDGKSLLIRDRVGEEPYGIFEVDLETRKRRRLTQPEVGDGDWRFEVSPDGKTLAFLRFVRPGSGDVYVMPAGGGQARRLTDWDAAISGIAWTPDGKEVVYTLEGRLWRIAANGARPGRGTPLRDVPMPAVGLSISRPGAGRGGRLVFRTATYRAGLYRVDLDAARDGDGRSAVERFVPSTHVSMPGRFSPDGSMVSFVSNRGSAGYELWIAGRDGSGPRQVTYLDSKGTLTAGSWSPDGKRLLFDAAAGGNRDVYIVAASGGAPFRLTTDPAVDQTAEWSRDGKWIYYSSLQRGTAPNIWRMPSAGGEAAQMTTEGGFEPQESADGRYLYYVDRVPAGRAGAADEARLMRMPAAGGRAEKVREGVTPFFWAVTQRGVYILKNEGPEAEIELAADGGGVRQAGRLPFRVPSALTPGRFTVSRDGRWALVNAAEPPDGDLMMIEDFR